MDDPNSHSLTWSTEIDVKIVWTTGIVIEQLRPMSIGNVVRPMMVQHAVPVDIVLMAASGFCQSKAIVVSVHCETTGLS